MLATCHNGQQPTHLGNLAQCSTLLSKVDDNTTTSILRLFDRFLDTKDEVGSAGADIGSKHITTITLLAVSCVDNSTCHRSSITSS